MARSTLSWREVSLCSAGPPCKGTAGGPGRAHGRGSSIPAAAKAGSKGALQQCTVQGLPLLLSKDGGKYEPVTVVAGLSSLRRLCVVS